MRRRFLVPAWVGFFLSVAALTATDARAQDLGVGGGVSPVQAKGQFEIVVENDMFWPGTGTDRLYSNGLFLHSQWTSPLFEKWTSWSGAKHFPPAADRAYLGFGISHELHTPETLNPCGARWGDPVATSANPQDVGVELCKQAEGDWARNYAMRDRPFAAIASGFVTAQRYFRAAEGTNGALTQGRAWGRIDVGKYGSRGALGYEVQKHWHGFFNDAFLDKGEQAARDPVGWTLAKKKQGVLAQVALGTGLSLYRWTAPLRMSRAGGEIEGRAQLQLGVPRDRAGTGLAVRYGVLPEHAARPVRTVGRYQPLGLYLEGSGDVSLMADGTYGDFDDYHHVLDEYSLGVVGFGRGVSIGFRLNWRRIAFKNPLDRYPATEAIGSPFHRYGRFAFEFTY